jgi:hypothetical protein
MTTRSRALLAALIACTAVTARAAVRPPSTTAAKKEFRHPGLLLDTQLLDGDSAFHDARSGRPASLILSVPLVPGDGVGNTLTWADTGRADEATVRERAWTGLLRYLEGRESTLGVDVSELATPRIGVFEDATFIVLYSQRTLNGIPVRDSSVTAIVNHGNLVLLGLQSWGEAGSRLTAPLIAEDAARAAVLRHVEPFVVELFMKSPHLEYVPMAGGAGYDYRLVWVVSARIRDDIGTWEGLVDAATGELLAFVDTNAYAARRVVGGVYPFSNDQRPPDGIEQAGWPMPFLNVTIGGNPFTTTTGGTLACSTGVATAALAGPFARINDSCGPVSESSAGDLDYGVSGGTDCVVPPGHSAGDTHAARTAFYEINRINEQAKGWLPGNAWLQTPITANTNQNLGTCGASYSGSTINFLRSNVNLCRNPGEIAGVVAHEWGHGMDANGVNPTISQPQEAIADIHAAMRHARSCIGRGLFTAMTCAGYGDACIGTPATGCTGVRDVDFALHRCNRPHTISWILNGFSQAQCTGGAPACPTSGISPCGRVTHCEGMVPGETVWDLYARDLQAPPFGFDANTALELAGRLAFLGSQAMTAWYTCAVGGGCGATGGYLLFLAADDDDGNIANGTPHMTAIRAAFERHEIHCAMPAPVNSGCAGAPTAVPAVTTTPTDGGVDLSWNVVPGAARYYVFRGEGVSGCDTGKAKIADVTGTTFSDVGLLGGRQYHYVVIPIGAATSCFGRASACASAIAATAACPAVADFTLTCNPAALTANQGGGATSTCTVQSINGFAAAVDLTCANLPANVTCAYSPGTVTPPPNTSVTSTLTVSVGPGVPAGSYNFLAQGQGGALTRTFPMSLTVNIVSVLPQALAVDTAGNHVLQPNETVDVAPSWRNNGTSAVTLIGATSGFTGPPGATYSNPDSTASYGTIPAGGTAPCTDCYSVSVIAPVRPVTHWDSTIVETVSQSSSTKTWTLHIGGSFTDVPASSSFFRFIETILHNGVTGGCTGTAYCPTASTTREQMAVFVLLSKSPTAPPPVPCVAGAETFADVPAGSPFCRWIEELERRGVVSGCGGDNYCPGAPATREQMAVFVLRTLDPTFTPPACGTPVFADVPASSPFCPWIEELVRRGVVTGCGGGNYCPTADVSREQMSVFLAVTFDLVLYGV